MTIDIKLYASFRNDRFAKDSRSYPEGSKIADIVGALGLAESELGTVLVNSRHSKPHCVLNDGDTLALFPLIGGG